MENGLSMTNQIEIYLTFDYRGETHAPKATVDLDLQMEAQGHLNPFHLLLAKENEIGLYSYELEVMESLPVQVSHATGLAVGFVSEEKYFDVEGFEAAWHQQSEKNRLKEMIASRFSEEALTANPQLEEALWEAYQLGKNAP